jgi:glycosyltransferase involved in cell wall biosynthesis
MRILFIAPDIPDYAVELTEIAATIGETLLIIPEKFALDRAVAETPRLQKKWVSWPKQSQIFRSIFFIFRLAKLIRKWKPDVIHILSEGNIWMNLLCPLLRPTPILTTVHDVRYHAGDTSSRRIPRTLVNILIRQSNAIIVHGEGLRNDAERELPVSRKPVFTFPHPPLTRYVKLAKQAGFKKNSNALFRVLFFGRIFAYKGLGTLVNAAPLIKAAVPNATFVIAGTGDDLANHLPRISTLPYIEVRDAFATSDDCAKLFAESDVLVLPYNEASQSGVLMIAMAFALPVVATRVGEIASVVESTGAGLLVPPNNHSALADSVIRIANNPPLHTALSNNARLAMLGKYSTNTLAEQLRELYVALLHGVMIDADNLSEIADPKGTAKR